MTQSIVMYMKSNQLHINAFEIHLSQEARIQTYNLRTEELQCIIQTCGKCGTRSKISNIFKNWMYKLISGHTALHPQIKH
jgi:hypothetical protein